MPGRCMPLARGTYFESSGYRSPDRPGHRGTDFGADYGVPVYAAADGWVCHVGINDDPQGYGSWIVIDHQAEHGVDTVYGHMPPSSFLVRYGDRVTAGQQIAVVGSEGGSSGPHLHFEVFGSPGRFGGADRDPNAWLFGAAEPGAPAPAPAAPAPAPAGDAVTYGVDISNHQGRAGLDLNRVFDEGFEFVIAKVSEGADYRDPYWRGFRDVARARGKILVGYHYVIAGDDVEAQAQTCVDHLGDLSIPVMLDHELNSGGIDTFNAVRAAIERRGARVALSYMPHWYWSGHMGQPGIAHIPPLMSSNYGNNRAGIASQIYPGHGDAGWNGYGGNTVAIFQFSERGSVAGLSIDVDAFRGTPDQLRAFLNPQEDFLSALTPDEQRRLYDLIDKELSYKFQSRVVTVDETGRETQSPFAETLVGYVLELDRKAYAAEQHAKSVDEKLDKILAALPAATAA
ncbi:peptidoglycan DD-metalloendopeptidase family protein [Rhodococcus opacus]|uniref:peptidoglycan DD-metalloendopeptidase family protein n=1 Tax=Rhodococcus opacus TaxID=37919 RepID=UPI001CEDC270|nr:peptidoglycan DD-metalloendopeptidase family protein [Rhodococcus opacus]